MQVQLWLAFFWYRLGKSMLEPYMVSFSHPCLHNMDICQPLLLLKSVDFKLIILDSATFFSTFPTRFISTHCWLFSWLPALLEPFIYWWLSVQDEDRQQPQWNSSFYVLPVELLIIIFRKLFVSKNMICMNLVKYNFWFDLALILFNIRTIIRCYWNILLLFHVYGDHSISRNLKPH